MTHIFLNGYRVLKSEKSGRQNYYLLSNNATISTKEIKLIETECPKCQQKRKLKRLHVYNKIKPRLCAVCASTGVNNPFYNRKHSHSTKVNISRSNKGILSGSKNPMYGKSLLEYWTEKYGKKEAIKRYNQAKEKNRIASTGTNNPFYGKKHGPELMAKIIENRRIWRSKLTEQEKQKISKNISKAQQKLKKSDPEYYRQIKSKAGKISNLNHKKYKINKIEKIVENKLKDLGIECQYSVILDFMQFDFGNKEKRVLLEVQGDYWHANPKLYKKSDYTEAQKVNVSKDKKKVKFANKHHLHLYHIWEYDILNNNFTILEEIKRKHFNEN